MIARVQTIIQEGTHLEVSDPTPGQIFIRRKWKLDDGPEATPQGTDDDNAASELVLPKSGWTKSLEHLPDFTDINIRAYASQSGKNVNRKSSVVVNKVCTQTCSKPERRGY